MKQACLPCFQHRSEQLQTLKDVTLSKLATALEAGVSQDGVSGLVSSCTREINAMSAIPAGLKRIAVQVFDAYLKPTLSIDEAATESAHASAIASIDPIVVKKAA